MLNLTHVLKSSLWAIVLFLSPIAAIPAWAGDNPNQNRGEGTSVFDQALDIDLLAFQTEGQAELEKIFGPLDSGARIYFQDGFASNGPGLIFDLARLFLIVPLPKDSGVSPLPYVTYFISPQGFKSIGFVGNYVEEKTIAFHAFGGAISYKDSVDAGEVAFKARVFQQAFPSLVFSAYPDLRLITIEAADGVLPTVENVEDQKGLLEQVAADADVEYWEDQSEFFPISYGFAPPMLLDAAAKPTIVDVNAFRTISLDQGLPTTIPSWPEPFGKGRIPNPEIQDHSTLNPIDVISDR